MKTPAAADLQRWSEDLARDATSLAFLPLARAYRRQGRRDAALRLCLAGLEAHPDHVEAHALLALLYLESGDSRSAADEWSIVLRLDMGNFEALRGLGFCFLEDNDLSRARFHLERAALIRPTDVSVQEALRLLRERIDAAEPVAGNRRDDGPDVIAEPTAAEPQHAAESERNTAVAQRTDDEARTVGMASNGAGAFGDDPSTAFDAFLGAGPLLGALLLDARGLVLAGRLGSDGAGDALGAVLGSTIGEAARAAGHLDLGAWNGMLVETTSATVHVSPVTDDTVVLIAAKRSAPMGWVLRTAAQVGGQARQLLGVA